MTSRAEPYPAGHPGVTPYPTLGACQIMREAATAHQLRASGQRTAV